MKITIQAITALLVLCVCLIGCTKNPATTSNPPPETAPSVSAATTGVPANDYSEVLALRTENYQSLSLKDFNAAAKAKIDRDTGFLSTFSDLMSSLSPDDSEYQFVYETLNYSITEVISPQMGNAVTLLQHLKKNDGAYSENGGETFYSFMFTALYSVEYRVIDEAALTVGERDALLSAYQSDLQNAVGDMSKEQLTAGNIKSEIQKTADDLASKLSTDTLVFENAEILSIEIHDSGQEYHR